MLSAIYFLAIAYGLGFILSNSGITRTGNLNTTVSVDYGTNDDYARAGLDYTAVSGTLTFDPGQSTKTFNIPLLDDALPELNEALTITLNNPVGIDLGLQNTAKLIIEEDDEIPFIIDQEILVSGLKEQGERLRLSGPTAFDWSPDGTMFVAQLNGIIRVFDSDSLLQEPFIDISDEVNTGGQRGLLGLAVHPNFPEQPYVYLAFSYDPPGVNPDREGVGRVTRLVRYTADANSDYRTALPNSELVLLETPPVQNFHAAGAIRFGNEGELFFSHGDGTQVSTSPTPEQAETLQSIDNPFGKLFRIDPLTGNGYSDNPFYNGDSTSIESKVYSYGLRNPWRYTIHPETGEPFIGDVGWTNWEEINTGKGNNFGWPLYEGGNGVSLRTTTLAEVPDFQELYADNESTVDAPIYSISHDDGGRSLTLGDFYFGNAYPEIYQKALFFADFYGENGVDALTFDAQGNIDSALSFSDQRWVSQLSIGPDSHLYYSSLISGQIGRWVINSPVAESPTESDDLIIGTNDDDVISSLDGDDTIIGGEGLDRLTGGFGNDWLSGKQGNDRLFGLENDDTLRGGKGSDVLRGNSGRDSLFGGSWKDVLLGGTDEDTLRGGAGDDKLFGEQDDDLLDGGTGNDTLKGGAGNDTLIAAQGNNRLFGGDGEDQFIIKSIEGRNLISDFELGVDRLGIPDNISLDQITITQNGSRTGTTVLDSLGRQIMVLNGINPDSLNINRDFI
ncbi:glucose/sorbosone dehydrogenase [Xenococcus sp. PCC 7305]|uniref:PQQ-dependent sugar dehydrogenase n=1 Tax=Xenococcus sp. PCC 7305 TaxID=102125 RepID=UPI0002ACF60A|nr:PQQ-dependent sugar dehydrogenase [Xenococcus sp. PCC 7305]ELS03177.1 glucose/sorbosone dehydrogenase [Xenococcus sp. PCC 7305]